MTETLHTPYSGTLGPLPKTTKFKVVKLLKSSYTTHTRPQGALAALAYGSSMEATRLQTTYLTCSLRSRRRGHTGPGHSGPAKGTAYLVTKIHGLHAPGLENMSARASSTYSSRSAAISFSTPAFAQARRRRHATYLHVKLPLRTSPDLPQHPHCAHRSPSPNKAGGLNVAVHAP